MVGIGWDDEPDTWKDARLEELDRVKLDLDDTIKRLAARHMEHVRICPECTA